MQPCLEEATLDELLAGALSGPLLTSALEHLDRCIECSAVVSVLAGGTALTPDLQPGERIGRHVVVRRLGEGAMGTVYLAHDPQLARDVAVKIVRTQGRGEGERAVLQERMAHEARTMARVSHPNVVAVYDVGPIGDGIFIAMELVVGTSLRNVVESAEGRDVGRLRLMLAQAAQGLAAAHRAGVVHRDFKPDNVLVGDDGRVRVTDFGVANAPSSDAVAAGAPAGSLTMTGALVGTPAYMAPELLAGGQATFATDQFAFGVTAYEVFVGRRPFAGSTIAELLAATEQAPSFTGTVLPAALRAAITRSLAHRPEDRFPDLNALVRAFDPPPRRSRVWAIAAVALGVLAAGSIAVAATRATPDPCGGGDATARHAFDDAREARVRAAFLATGAPNAADAADRVARDLRAYGEGWKGAYRQTCIATHVRHEQSPALLDARMECLKRANAEASAVGEALEHADREAVASAALAIARLPRTDECARAEGLGARDPRPHGDALAKLEALEQKLAAVEARSRVGVVVDPSEVDPLVASAEAIAWRPAIADAKLRRAALARRSSRHEPATDDARSAVLLAEAARDDRLVALSWMELVATSIEEKNSKMALDRADHARAAISRIGTPRELEASIAHLVGLALMQRGDLDEAQKSFDLALSRRRALYGEKHVEIARVLSAVGNVQRERGELDRALETHRSALAMDEEALGKAHPGLARHQHNIGGVLRLQGKLDDALAAYLRARELELAAGTKTRALGQTENSIGLVMLAKKDLPRAKEQFERALAVLEGHPDRALALENLGLVAAASGDHAQAIARFEEAQAVSSAALGADYERLAMILAAAAASERALGRDAAARAHFEAAIAAARRRERESTEHRALLASLLEASPPAPTSPFAKKRIAPPKPAPFTPPTPTAAPPAKPSNGGAYSSSQSTDTRQ